MRTRTWGPLLAALTAGAILLTGCGGSDGGSDKDNDKGSSQDSDNFADQSAAQIAEQTKKAMEDLEAVTIEGKLTSDGQEIELRMEIGSGGDCQGQFTTQGATAEILGVDGQTWFKPDEAFWTLQAGADQGAQIAAAVGDKWVTLPQDDTSFAQFCDIDEFLKELNDTSDATYEKGDTKEIDGQQAIEIISSQKDEGDSSGYVQLEGDHYLLQIEKTEGDEPGTVNFSGFDEQPDVEAPGADEQVSLDELG